MKAVGRVLAILIKELRQLARDRLTFGMIIGIPLIQMCLFGYAINTDVRNLVAGFVDAADTSASRRLLTDIEASQVAILERAFTSPESLLAAMRAGELKLGVVIPADFERRLRDPSRHAAQLLVDGSDPTLLGVARQLAMMPVASRNGAMPASTPVMEIRNYFNPERRSAVQIVPALIGVILTLTMVLFTSVAIVRERERGNFELLITTPVRTVELMIGKIVPYILIGLLQVTIVLAVGKLLFDVPIVGRVADMYAASLIFIMATLGLGLTISTIARSQFQAMQLAFFFFLPSILLSGFLFPFDGMPPVARYIGAVLPLTHFVDMARGIMLRGATLGELQPRMLALAAFFVVSMVVAISRFSKKLD